MRWQPTAMPPSAAALLNKARAGRGVRGAEFSRAQEFVAALSYYATLPVELQLKIVQEFGIVAAESTDDRVFT
jgi:hypothetical protein